MRVEGSSEGSGSSEEEGEGEAGTKTGLLEGVAVMERDGVLEEEEEGIGLGEREISGFLEEVGVAVTVPVRVLVLEEEGGLFGLMVTATEPLDECFVKLSMLLGTVLPIAAMKKIWLPRGIKGWAKLSPVLSKRVNRMERLEPEYTAAPG